MNSSIYFDTSVQDTSCQEEEVIQKEKSGNIMVFKIHLKNAIIVLMDHPSSLTVYQYVSVEALSGSASIFGCEIKPGSPPVKVFSSEKTGLIEIKTETFDRIWRRKDAPAILEQDLYKITDDSGKASEILKNFGNCTIGIVIRCCVLPHNVQILEIYYPHVLEFNLFRNKRHGRDQYHVPSSKERPIEFELEAEKLVVAVDKYIRTKGHKVQQGVPPPRILICGPKNTGKSSMARFLVNKIVSVYGKSYYLDADPGQTEFTPPAVVSLTKVTKPVIGPTFMHLIKPLSMIFTGGISPDSSPDMYCKSVSKLVDLYQSKYHDETLFVNTLGWMEGLGLFCLQNVLKIVKPDVLIELVNEDEMSMFDYREYLPKDSLYFQLKRSFEPKQSHLQARELRDLSVLGYLGKCLNEFEGPKYVNEMKPYRVCWDNIPVFIFGKKVPPYRMIEALNASIVALCKVPKSAILESDIPLCPKTLEDEPDNECIGFGLVRAIDEKNHVLYIISPLSSSEIKRVNAILKGNVMVPDAILLNQPLKNTPLPFTNERDIEPEDDEEEMPDCSLLSLKSTSEVESPAAKSTPSNSVKFGRKKISKRFKLKKK